MGINLFHRAILAVLILSFPSAVMAFDPIDQSVIFAKVAQGHHGDNSNVCHQISSPQLMINGNGIINGTGGAALDYCSSNDGSGLANNSCDNGSGGVRKCTIDGSDIRGLKLTGSNAFLSSSGAGGGYGSCNSGEQLTLGANGQNQFSNVSLYSACTLTLSATQNEYRFNTIAIGGGATLVLSEGDYWVDSFTLNQNAKVILQGNVRIFTKQKFELNGGKFNENNTASALIIGYSDIQLNSDALLNGRVYSDATLSLNNNSIINGRVTSRYLVMSGGSINEDLPVAPLQLQFGKATTTSVTFANAFPVGVKPLIFLMPTISTANTSNDGPASTFVSSVTNTGFTWVQSEPTSPSNRYIASNSMPEVHWIAVTAGSHVLSDGSQLEAGRISTVNALNMSNSAWTNVPLNTSLNVVLNQLQTRNNSSCWLTSVAQLNSSGIQLNLDTSEVRSGTQCKPGNLRSLQSETIGYLAVKSSVGTVILNGEDVHYQFGTALTHTGGGNTKTLAEQCAYNTSLTGFVNPPTLVAGKDSRRGGDGGWLRRCNLSATQVSMVNDEDTYGDSERSHLAEDYGFVALEKVAPVEECFTDDFSRSSLGNDWATKVLGSSTPPAINGGRLRITPALGNQATASTYQRLFPAEGNLVTIEFDYYAWSPTSGTGGDGVAVILSDASVTPQPGSFGGSLGYAQRDDGTPGFAGGWIGVGLDEYGNFSNPNEGKIGGPGFRSQSVTLRGSVAANYQYLAGTAANLNPRIDVRSTSTAAPNHKYRIKVDSTITGQAWVSLDRDVRDGNGYQVLVPRFNARAISGQDSVPADFYLSFTGSTGGANNNHEIDNFKVCAIKSKPIGLQVHHFEFDYSSSPLTCKAEPMQIRACADGNIPCTLFTDPVSAQLSLNPASNGGWYQNGSSVSNVGFINGIASVDLRHNVTTPVTIGVSSSNPATVPGSNTLCRSGAGALSTAACTLSFADSGFLIDMPDKLANKAQNATISAVRKSNDNLECVPTFAGQTKRVDLWSQYISPVATSMFTPTAVSINSASISGSSLSPSSQNLTFDASGKATIAVNYSDAGKVELNAKYTGVAGTPDEGLVMIGSDPFVSFPVGLCITPKDSGALCPAGDVSCAVYKKAGESFNLQIAAKAWVIDNDSNYCDNPSTPNYVQSGIALSSQLVAPSPGAQGEVGIASYDQVAATNNLNTVVQSISEVGVFTFSAAPPASYLGSSFYSIPLAKSTNIGRFVPDRFGVNAPSVMPACSNSFSYMDQNFAVAFNLKALNIAGVVTENYRGSFAKASGLLVGENNDDGNDMQARLNDVVVPLQSSSWVIGEANIDYQPHFSRLPALVGGEVDGTYEQMLLGIKVFDNDGNVSSVATPNMNAATLGDCSVGSNCDAVVLSANQQKYRHGRVVMDNTYGPETEILRMPTRAEYWNGSSWVLNTNDSCTTAVYGLGSQVDNAGLGYNFDPDLVVGQSVTRSGGTATFQAGQFELLWQAVTSSGAPYRGQVTAPLDVPTWLEWYWNWNSVSPTDLTDPRASAYFGRYRGHDKIIYWREVN
ncbi:MSHA biogenesis protein MshQ [Shewanella sp. SP2S2-6]|uniref:DUF6701 domain-containing protein n=1 Tax=Shewanella sp. SP2S2-6 TaxID=3063540 RepID=UPI00289136A4|nr:DUF6701 domain-containing protein [Shewanella sp. SP2S2-6]MDT3295291.1 MSHA biogenesis protein MshQ [Shewanella sp. SP2S2-6]